MREIKFRGKDRQRLWHYGDLRHHANKDVCIYPQDGKGYGVGVDPLTVGEYTGEKDKDGREIYEHDIVRVTIRICGNDGNPSSYSYVGAVCMYNGTWAVEFEEEKFGVKQIEHRSLSPYKHYDCNPHVVVLGNVHDNPSFESIDDINNEEK